MLYFHFVDLIPTVLFYHYESNVTMLIGNSTKIPGNDQLTDNMITGSLLHTHAENGRLKREISAANMDTVTCLFVFPCVPVKVTSQVKGYCTIWNVSVCSNGPSVHYTLVSLISKRQTYLHVATLKND